MLLKSEQRPFERSDRVSHGSPDAITNRDAFALPPGQRGEHGGRAATIAGKTTLELFIQSRQLTRQRFGRVTGHQSRQLVARDRARLAQQR